MRIAIPVADGLINQHFGGSRSFWLCEATTNPPAFNGAREIAVAECGGCAAIATFLDQQGVELVIAGGIGAGAAGHLRSCGIEVVAGISGGKPQDIATDYLAGRLAPSGILCQAHAHGDGHGHGHGHGQGACGHRHQEGR
jgi:predicted Fe-Mo cluster-binding NifX family protein